MMIDITSASGNMNRLMADGGQTGFEVALWPFPISFRQAEKVAGTLTELCL